MSDTTDRIDKIDRMLFDAGVLVYSDRRAADRKITDARVELDKLRSRFE